MWLLLCIPPPESESISYCHSPCPVRPVILLSLSPSGGQCPLHLLLLLLRLKLADCKYITIIKMCEIEAANWICLVESSNDDDDDNK